MAQRNSCARANFDVGVLFYNRARQTLDCIRSFLSEEIQPAIIILDQDSAPDQRAFLVGALAGLPNIQFVSSSRNIGVAAGRNRICRESSSEWIFFVDNDLILNTRGGVKLINSVLQKRDGIDAFSPLILNVHENRFADRLQIVGTNGRLQITTLALGTPTTNTFAGGGTLLRRSLLLNRPYDESYFIGFEDFDLALDAFTAGRPLHVQSLDCVTLVHRHMPVTSAADIAATRTRYSIRSIRESFALLARKYGDEVCPGWQDWTEHQQRRMIDAQPIAQGRPADGPTRVTFVLDVPNWAFDNVVKNLQRHMGPDHILTIVYAQQDDDAGGSLRHILDSSPHIIHFMWRADFRRLVSTAALQRCAALMGVSQNEILARLCRSCISFSVCDHLFLTEDEIAAFRPLYWLSDGYCTVSPMLFDIYRAISDYPEPLGLLVNGVDTTLYHPVEAERPQTSTIRIGWVGNSSWGQGQGLSDAKGLATIIRPAIAALRAEGINVELLAVDRVERWRPREEVAALYREMDVYTCASSIEGTPNTVLEAMASGLPIVATQVGIVPYLFGVRQQAFIVERSVQAFTNALRQLCTDHRLRRDLAQENLQQISNHRWQGRAPLWRRFFADVIARSHPDAANWKRYMIERFYLEPNLAEVPAIQPPKQTMSTKAIALLRSATGWIRRS